MKLFLDDYRLPPKGWWWAKTVTEARQLILHAIREGEPFEAVSLDHDLGACMTCMHGLTVEEWSAERAYEAMPNCSHFGTGYDLVCWMEATGHWPQTKPVVHSANFFGRKRMEMAIDRAYVPV